MRRIIYKSTTTQTKEQTLSLMTSNYVTSQNISLLKMWEQMSKISCQQIHQENMILHNTQVPEPMNFKTRLDYFGENNVNKCINMCQPTRITIPPVTRTTLWYSEISYRLYKQGPHNKHKILLKGSIPCSLFCLHQKGGIMHLAHCPIGKVVPLYRGRGGLYLP